ncbi:MAG: rod shape-determining protein MreC [Bacteroidales bacterium]|jgi:rod shape-determining protein MreC|nr:rod shape-determining protein MreC [Bacteroidales bacterium]MDY0196606.1 rod shape-determining protein MreC [Tenuifilaceae bacterium]
MNSLLRFIVKYQFLLLFLALEIFSLWLLSNHTYYQKSKIENVARSVSGYANSKINSAQSYFNLSETNRVLSQENLELRKQVATLSAKTEALYEMMGDTITDSLYLFKPAKVVNNSVNKQYNYLTLNKGSNHGVETEMGVVTNNGIIGIVIGVSPNYSTVISLLNVDLKISAKLKKSNHFGSLFWEGNSYQHITLGDIPQHVPIGIGDTIVTSEFSSIFPENIPIGVISSFSSKGSNFHTIKVKLFKDFKQLYNVWIVTNKQKQEKERLETLKDVG